MDNNTPTRSSALAADPPSPAPHLPSSAPGRDALHNEVHARPSARIRLPALVIYVAVLNDGVTREAECEHLRQLPQQGHLTPEDMADNFLRLRFADHTVKWERHSEFSRYSIVQPLPERALLGASDPELLSALTLPPEWLSRIPGQTMVAVKLAMLHGDLTTPDATLAQARHWLGDHTLVASVMGNNGHSWALTDFALRDSGFERMLVIAPAGTTDTRAGRISQRLLELETYRLMALRGLPVAKALMPTLTTTEQELADITAQIEHGNGSDPELLNHLATLAARVEQATASHAYRFAATEAYHGIVGQRIAELRERAIPGTQTIGEFMNRRLSPAMATVSATARRLSTLSERITRATALLRTRVDIATETQNQLLLEKLTKGQELQLRLQSTVEGLSIAAISYYVVSLLLYLGKAAKAAGAPINPEMAAGAAIPLVLWAVWRTTQRIHQKLHAGH
ncbi:MAG: DUF3422 domain-containing protein [Burkholderiaceae bacterium]|nr:DUF3422 domain-containing protein [Burkholderiaceae bacterium]MDZ4161317.1 DUF3422 domain-containing protein [Burkholderiales bacterium]